MRSRTVAADDFAFNARTKLVHNVVMHYRTHHRVHSLFVVVYQTTKV